MLNGDSLYYSYVYSVEVFHNGDIKKLWIFHLDSCNSLLTGNFCSSLTHVFCSSQNTFFKLNSLLTFLTTLIELTFLFISIAASEPSSFFPFAVATSSL